jgi:hypothetical protein
MPRIATTWFNAAMYSSFVGARRISVAEEHSHLSRGEESVLADSIVDTVFVLSLLFVLDPLDFDIPLSIDIPLGKELFPDFFKSRTIVP